MLLFKFFHPIVNPFKTEEMVTPFFLTKSQAKPKFHKKDEPHVCSVYIYTDPFLWRQMYKLQGNKLLQPITITDHESFKLVKKSNTVITYTYVKYSSPLFLHPSFRPTFFLLTFLLQKSVCMH